MSPPPRRHDPEWMDRAGNDDALVERAHRDLALSNRWLGGERALASALEPWLRSAPADGVSDLLDVGAGGGDLGRAMIRHAARLERTLRVVAVDRDPAAVAFAARSRPAGDALQLVQADAFALPFLPRSFDFVTASLFLHHFRHDDVVRLLAGFQALARRAVLVSDLRRHRLPWLFLSVAPRATGRSPMFVHDGPLSVLRAFTPAELLDAARAAGGAGARVERRWPFRLLLTIPAQGHAR